MLGQAHGVEGLVPVCMLDNKQAAVKQLLRQFVYFRVRAVVDFSSAPVKGERMLSFKEVSRVCCCVTRSHERASALALACRIDCQNKQLPQGESFTVTAVVTRLAFHWRGQHKVGSIAPL